MTSGRLEGPTNASRRDRQAASRRVEMRAKAGATCGAALGWLLVEVLVFQLVSSSPGSDLFEHGNQSGNSIHLASSTAIGAANKSIDENVAKSKQNQPIFKTQLDKWIASQQHKFGSPSIFSRKPAESWKGRMRIRIRSGSGRSRSLDQVGKSATAQIMSTNLAANAIGQPVDTLTSQPGRTGNQSDERRTDPIDFLVAGSKKLADNRWQQRGNDRRLIGEKLLPTQSTQAHKRYEGHRLSMEMDISGSLGGANLDSSQDNGNTTSQPTKLISANQTKSSSDPTDQLSSKSRRQASPSLATSAIAPDDRHPKRAQADRQTSFEIYELKSTKTASRKKNKEPTVATVKPVVLASDVRVMSNLLLVGNDSAGSEPPSTGSAALDSSSQSDSNLESRPAPGEQPNEPSDWFVVSSDAVDSDDSLKPAKQAERLDSATQSDKANRASEISRAQVPKMSPHKSDLVSILSQLRDQLNGSAAHSRTSLVEIPKIGDIKVKSKAGGFDGSQFAKSTSLGIRVTAGQNSAPLVINNRGLITAAKGKPIFANNNNTVVYNPANSLISQMDYSLSPSDKQSYAAGSAKYKPVWAHLGADLEDRPSFLKQPITLSGQQFWGDSDSNSMHHNTGLREPSLDDQIEASSMANRIPYKPTERPSIANSAMHLTSSHGSKVRPSVQVAQDDNSISTEDEAQSTKVIQTSVLDAPLDQTSVPTGANQTDSNSSTFQHNPPYTKLHQSQPNANQTEIQPQLTESPRSKTKNRTNQPTVQKPAKRPVIPNRLKPEVNFSNGSYSTLVGEPIDLSSTTMSSATNDPLSYSDHKPTQLRNKLHSILLAKLAPAKQNQSPFNSTAYAQRGPSAGSSGQVTPAPLLSSTAAQNLASLLAQGFSQLIQGPTRNGNRFNSLLANRLRRRVNHMSNSKIDAHHTAVNRRTTNVGSLLLSGFIYGLSVLPALMALTGNNPLNGFNLADDSSSSPSAKRATTAINRHGSAARIGAQAERMRKSQKSARAPIALNRPTFADSPRATSMGLDSLLDTYLVQLDPVTTMASPTTDEEQDLKTALKYYLESSAPVANQLNQLHPLLDADSDTDFGSFENLGKNVLISRYSDASLVSETPKFGSNSINDQLVAQPEPQKAASIVGNDNMNSLADDKQAKFNLRVTEQPDQTAFTPLVLIPIAQTDVGDKRTNYIGGETSTGASVHVPMIATNSGLEHSTSRPGVSTPNQMAKSQTSRHPNLIPIEKPSKSRHKMEAYLDNSNRKVSIDAAPTSSGNLDTISADNIAILGPYDMNPGFEQSLSFIPLESVDLSTATSNRSPKQPANKYHTRRDRHGLQSMGRVRANQLANVLTPSDRIAQMRYKPISGHKTNEQQSGFKSLDIDNSWRISRPIVRRQQQQLKLVDFGLNKLISAQKGELQDQWMAKRRKSSYKTPSDEPLMLGTRTKKAPTELRRSSGSLKSTTKASNGSKKSSSTSVLNPLRFESQNPKGSFNDTVGELLLAHSLAMGSRILNEPYEMSGEFKRVRN